MEKQSNGKTGRKLRQAVPRKEGPRLHLELAPRGAWKTRKPIRRNGGGRGRRRATWSRKPRGHLASGRPPSLRVWPGSPLPRLAGPSQAVSVPDPEPAPPAALGHRTEPDKDAGCRSLPAFSGHHQTL